MTTIELGADILQRDSQTLLMHMSDFTDAEMFVRPCPGANHATWQLGHLIVAESNIVNGCWPGAVPSLPAEFAAKFAKANAGIDSPSAFVSKDQLIQAFTAARGSTIAWVKTLKEEDLAKAISGSIAQWVPSIGHLPFVLAIHTTMHLGQFQVIRRKLGKPVLF
jgi:hypothetical protein